MSLKVMISECQFLVFFDGVIEGVFQELVVQFFFFYKPDEVKAGSGGLPFIRWLFFMASLDAAQATKLDVILLFEALQQLSGILVARDNDGPYLMEWDLI
jgi:hypothetical protein